jgi:hypothetical protein
MGLKVAGLYTFNGVNVNSVGAFEKLSQWELSADKAITAELSTDSIRIDIPGGYTVHCSLSFLGEADVTYYAELRVNGLRVAGGLVAAQEVTVADKPFNMSIVGAGNFKVDDLVSVYVGSDEVGGANFQLLYGQLGVMGWS